MNNKSTTTFDFENFFESSLDLMCISNHEGYFIKVNSTFETVLGYSKQELLSKPYSSFIFPEDLSNTNVVRQQVSSGQPLLFFENRYVCKDGSIKWLSWKSMSAGDLVYSTARDVTNAKEIEQNQLSEKQQLQFILESAPISLFSTDKNGTILLSTGQIHTRLGVKQNSSVGRNIIEMNETSLPEISRAAREALLGKEATSFCTINDLYLESKYSPIFDKNNEVIGLIGVTMDVTESKKYLEQIDALKAERLALEADEQFRETFDRAAVGIAHFNVKGNFIKVNKELCNMSGYEEHELLGMSIWDVTHQDDIIDEKEGLQEIISGLDTTFAREKRYVRKDGSTIWIWTQVSCVRDSQGEIKYFISAKQDITPLKRSEEALRKSEESFRSLTEAIPQIVWTADAEGRIYFCNRRWFDYTGLQNKKDGPISWIPALHPDDQVRFTSQWPSFINSHEPYEFEYRFLNIQNGTYRWHLGRAIPLKNHEGRILKWFGTCTDIDDQKRVQEELQKSLSDLRQITEEKAKLLASEKAALEASELKSQFLANLSHEIRTPLNGILGTSQLLETTELSEEQADYVKTLRQSGDTLLALITDVLDFSKIEAGKIDLEKSNFDVITLVNEASKVFEYSASNKGLKFVVNTPQSGQHFLRGDPLRLRQILFNLLQNAIKFTAQGQVVVECSIVPTTSSSYDLLHLSVCDTGIGIDPSALEKIFTAFGQADASTTRKYGGTGLGLSISKRLAELFGGKISVKSELGVGSTFKVELPFERGLQIQTLKKESLDLLIEDFPSKGQVRILVAEDHPINQKLVRRAIEKMGFKVDIFETGKAAVAALSKQNYDLILMDCHMPEMDGFEAARRIRSNKKNHIFQNIPIIALTADVLKGTKEKCLACGMNDYLRKPINFLDLKSALSRHLKSSKLNRPKVKPNLSLINLSAIEALESMNQPGQSDIVVELIDDYLAKSPLLISKFNGYIEKKNFEKMEFNAHALKSSSGAIGARKNAKLCALIEVAAQKKKISLIKKLFKAFVISFEETKIELNKLAFQHRSSISEKALKYR